MANHYTRRRGEEEEIRERKLRKIIENRRNLKEILTKCGIKHLNTKNLKGNQVKERGKDREIGQQGGEKREEKLVTSWSGRISSLNSYSVRCSKPS